MASVNESVASLYASVCSACALPSDDSFRLRKVLGGGAGVGR